MAIWTKLRYIPVDLSLYKDFTTATIFEIYVENDVKYIKPILSADFGYYNYEFTNNFMLIKYDDESIRLDEFLDFSPRLHYNWTHFTEDLEQREVCEYSHIRNQFRNQEVLYHKKIYYCDISNIDKEIKPGTYIDRLEM